MTGLRSKISAIAAISLGAVLAMTNVSAARCGLWDMNGEWTVTQSNGPVVHFSLKQRPNGDIAGTGRFPRAGALVDGSVGGHMSGNASFRLEVEWRITNDLAGRYTGNVTPDGTVIDGVTQPTAGPPGKKATFSFDRVLKCMMEAQPTAQTPPSSATPDTETLHKHAYAIDDADVHSGPGPQFEVIGIIRATKGFRRVAQVVDHNPDGWSQLKGGWLTLDDPPVTGDLGWVADDHLKFGTTKY
jgi:hypothetical protein